jgi:hypothetical protein
MPTPATTPGPGPAHEHPPPSAAGPPPTQAPQASATTAERLLSEWADSTAKVRQVAAAWGRELLSLPEGTRVESSMRASGRLNVDHSTVVRARNLLMGAGIIRKSPSDNRYHVGRPR